VLRGSERILCLNASFIQLQIGCGSGPASHADVTSFSMQEEADARAAAAAKELAASVPRKDHVATVNQLLETQKKLTENLTDKTQVVLAQTEADRVKEELGKLKAEAEKVEKERALLVENCAQLDGVLREIREGELGDAKLREEVVALRVSSAHAQRRAEMAAQERMLAESVREGAEKRLRELEGQVRKFLTTPHMYHVCLRL
jgi:hypothetical protein